MRIGFFGKGGSGKTTLSALTALFLDEKDYRTAVLDVDVNSQTANLLPVKAQKPELSNKQSVEDIWRYLAGDNLRVKSDEFLNTTPPGYASGQWRLAPDNYLTRRYGRPFGKFSHSFTLGSYKSEGIGTACHHSTQSVAENMISHSFLDTKDCLITDSVAGNDAFGTTLFLHDLLVFVIKPEREGVDVFTRFMSLAAAAGIEDRVVVLGNQTQFSIQRDFIKNAIDPSRLIGCLSLSESMVAARLADQPVSLEQLDEQSKETFYKLGKHIEKAQHDPCYLHTRLVELHRQVTRESWVAGSYRTGMEDQIDEEYIPGC